MSAQYDENGGNTVVSRFDINDGNVEFKIFDTNGRMLYLKGASKITVDVDLVKQPQRVIELLEKENIDIEGQHNDGGMMIFDTDKQDTHAGGSGCGCCASVLCSIILEKMCQKALKNVLVIATGALMSPTANQQGESIPAIAHLIHLKA